MVSAPAGVRGELRAAFAEWELDDDAVDDALLVAEELVTNVVDHAGTPFRLTARFDNPLLHIAVRDSCPRPVQVQELDPTRCRGRGLLVIARLSARWGSDHDGAGKTVWAELAL